MTIIGCILAGGRGRRMGGRDKAVIELAGAALWQRALAQLSPIADDVIATGPTAPDWANKVTTITYVADTALGSAPIGPAGGLLAALDYALVQYGPRARVLTAPVDAPFVPTKLLRQLIAEGTDASATIAASNRQLQPAFGVWRANLAPDVRRCVEAGDLAMHRIAGYVAAKTVNFDCNGDAFLNINSREDLARAESVVRTLAENG